MLLHVELKNWKAFSKKRIILNRFKSSGFINLFVTNGSLFNKIS